MKINYLQEAYIKDIASMKAKIDNKLTADDIRADAKRVWTKEVSDFLAKFVFEHCDKLQLLPKTSIFLQDVRNDVAGGWSWYNLPLWGKPYRGVFDLDELREFGRDTNPIEVKGISNGVIHINYNLGRPIKIHVWNGEYAGELGEKKAIGIACNNLYNRLKSGKEITKDRLSNAFIITLKDVLRKNIGYGDEIENADLDVANFILESDIVVDNITIDLSKDLYVKGVVTREYYDEKDEKWIQYDLPFNENDITLSKFIRERLDAIFTFVGPGKIYLKRGRDIVGEI